MFKRLRNKLIAINMGVTSVVVLVVFTAIYFSSTRSAENRPVRPMEWSVTVDDGDKEYIERFEDYVIVSLREERQLAARNLLVTLIVSGIAIELMVFLVSYLTAEQAIKPVREAYDAQKIFIANASHEIKTPLAAIQANLEAADVRNNKWIRNVEIETTKLAELNGELLNLARTDLTNEVKVEEVDLRTVTLGVLESFEPRLGSKTLKKTLAVPGKLKINMADFSQILTILIDNAVKYSDREISIELRPHQLIVANDGATIPADKISHVFDRFYQVDKTTEGVGLGLAIAKSVAERNHWKITASSNNGKTRFVLDF